MKGHKKRGKKYSEEVGFNKEPFSKVRGQIWLPLVTADFWRASVDPGFMAIHPGDHSTSLSGFATRENLFALINSYNHKILCLCFVRKHLLCFNSHTIHC